MTHYFDKYVKYKNKFFNLRKQIGEFNVINEDRKIKDFSDPINKNKYVACKATYLNLFSRIENDSIILNTENKNKFFNLRKQIEEFNVINEDRKIKDFSDPINKNKYVALKGGSVEVFNNEDNLFCSKYKLGEVKEFEGSGGTKSVEIKLEDNVIGYVVCSPIHLQGIFRPLFNNKDMHIRFKNILENQAYELYINSLLRK
jgi:hypothetical protein